MPEPARARRTRHAAAERRRAPERRAAPERGAARARSEVATEDRIRAWVRSADPDALVAMGPPGEAPEGRGASVYLLDVVPQPAVRGAGRPPLQLWLRYLVSTWAEERTAADRLLVELAYAAMEQPDIEIDPEVTLPETWTALRAVARPSFIVRVTERRARARPVAPLVLHPIRIEPAFLPSTIAGVVRGPGGIALPDATVALPSVGRESRTDARGRFQLLGVPAPPVSTHLVVRARGTETVVKLPKDPARARALVIEIKSLEGVNA